MSKVMRPVLLAAMVGAVLAAALISADSAPVQAVPAAEPAPPDGQTYTGAKECASCHFKQYMAWKKTGHAKTFGLLTAKYENDTKCLKCHTTGYGEPTGYKTAADTNLQGTTCEACHGPGSRHGEICKKYGKKKLTEAEEKIARDSIWLMVPKNVCVECHNLQAHRESETPKEMMGK